MVTRVRLLVSALAVLAFASGPAAAGAATGAPRSGGAHAGVRASRRQVLHETVALSPRDPAALAAYAAAVADPASPLYRHYLSVAQFARRFGPTVAQVASVRRLLARHGLVAGTLSASHLELSVAGAARASHAFTAAVARPAGGSAGTAFSTSSGGLVQGVIAPGAPAPTASIVLRSAHPALVPRPHGASALATAGPQACSAASQTAADGGAYTAGQIGAAYGLSNYWAAGNEGQGITIALYELEPFSASDVAAYQACYGTAANVSVVPVDGGAGSGAGSGEAAMDVEDLIGLAPRATIDVYEAPANGAGAFDAYSRMISDDSAQVISTSWGLCEAQQGAATARAENTLFQEAAVQGQTVVAASGDQGSDDCGSGQQAVDDPASQPYVTGVGATTLQGPVNSVWNDSLGATGGGVSQLWGLPSYQSGFAQPQSSVTCGASGTSCREVPDLSLDGDPETGYVAYWQGAWRLVGGTSVSAPTVAALTALADASPACAGHPIGFLNQALYRVAGSEYALAFNDVTAGSNSLDGVPGFSAGPGYDMASGLGTPGAALGQALCGQGGAVTPPNSGSSSSGPGSSGHGPTAVTASQPVTITAPHVGLAHVGSRVRLRLRAHDSRHASLTWSVSGLPHGLRIDQRTGLISGVPVTPSSGTVRLRASDGHGGAGTISFKWTVAGAPSVVAHLVRARGAGTVLTLRARAG
ncbi:MAG: protease pro-enzyme activation domain-containing protein, partial [Solirubrobacteraceae bacterium]